MSDDVCMVAVDVGNSAVKFAVQRGTTIVDHAIRVEGERWEYNAIDWAKAQLGCGQWHWRIASVHGSAADRLAAAIDHCDPVARIQHVTRHHVPMTTAVDHPDRLGIDRLLSAYAVRNRFDTPAVVIDAGSAVTVDLVSAEGDFCGGAILPGLGLQASVLATGTAALPRIRWDSDTKILAPAKNTTDAIHLGILTGIAAGIDALIEQYRSAAGGSHQSEIQVVMTGGDGPAISAHLRHNHQVMPNLVCRGLFDLPRSIESPL